MATRMAQLQEQVTWLRDELAANRAEAERARQALVAAQAQRQAAAPPPAPEQQQASIAQPNRQDSAAVALAERRDPHPAAEQHDPPATAERHDASAVAERHEPAPAERHDAAFAERREPAAPEHREAAPLTERRELARAAATRPSPPHQEAEDAQSVLARLRQVSPGSPPADMPPAARADSPSLRRLIAARSALAAGKVEETRRLLQEAQLQLVFRPAGASEDDPASAGRAAADVARALEALSGNDPGQGRSAIDRAVNDMSGRAMTTPDREASSQGTGYAPAYPVR
jgi:hypothetical protein